MKFNKHTMWVGTNSLRRALESKASDLIDGVRKAYDRQAWLVALGLITEYVDCRLNGFPEPAEWMDNHFLNYIPLLSKGIGEDIDHARAALNASNHALGAAKAELAEANELLDYRAQKIAELKAQLDESTNVAETFRKKIGEMKQREEHLRKDVLAVDALYQETKAALRGLWEATSLGLLVSRLRLELANKISTILSSKGFHYDVHAETVRPEQEGATGSIRD